MTLCALLFQGGGLKFDWTVNVGNIVSVAVFLVLAVVAWTNLRWRVKNLEAWQQQHVIDTGKQDDIIERMDRLLIRIEQFIGMSDQRKYGTIRTRKDDPA